MDLFIEISIIILIAVVISMVMKTLKQPFIIGYILTGILVGPYFLNIFQSKENIEFFSKIGITILLFIVGLHLNPNVIREVGKISLVTGLGQVFFTSIIGYFICLAIGLSPIAAIYIAIALTFSSTIIILKLLSDKGDLDKLYGKISIGFLLVQDIFAALILIGITATAGTAGQTNLSLALGGMAIKGILLALILIIANRIVIPKITAFMASSQELLFLFSLAWGIGMAALFYKAGFSIEIGALAAGVVLSTNQFATEIGSRIRPLRDFFVLLFFIFLGSQVLLESISQIFLPALILSLFVLIGNPLIVIILMNLLGYKRKTGFLAGLTVAQISEFSLILAALGVSVGHLSNEMLSLVTLVGLITIAGSTYLILYSSRIYSLVEPIIKFFEFRKIVREKGLGDDKSYEIVLFGYDRVGADFVKAIKKLDKSFIVVDFSPKSIKLLGKQGIPCVFGDAEDIEFLNELGLSNIKLIVSTIPDFETNKLLIKYINNINPSAITIVISHYIKQAKELYLLGATYVVMPHYLGAQFASRMITRYGIDKKKFIEEQKRHQEQLEKRYNIV